MRVLHVVHQFPPHFLGGTELYTPAAAQGMAERGHEVAVFTRSRGQGRGLATDCEGGLTVFRAWEGDPSPAARYAASFESGYLLAGFDQVMAEFRPDVVHVQHLMGLPLAILARLRRARLPYVVTLHDYWWVCANALLVTNYSEQICAGPRGYINCTRCAVARGGAQAALIAPALWGSLVWRGAALRRGLADASALLAATRFVADWYAAHGAPAERLRILPLGVDRPENLTRTRCSPSLPLQFVYIGSLAWLKGVHIALEAVTGLEGALDLWVAGDPPTDLAYRERLVASAGSHVHFMGRLDRAGVWRLLANADVLLAPSLSYETYCYSVHEALAAGVPVIASNLGVLAEVVQDGVNGLLAAPGDVAAWRAAITRLVEDPGLVARLAAGTRPPLGVAAHLAQLEDVYHAAVRDKSP